MKLISGFYIFAFISILLSCSSKNVISESNNFNKKLIYYFENIWELNPLAASQVGNHKYDDKLTITDANYFKSYEHLLDNQLAVFKSIQDTELSPEQIVDRDLVLNNIKYEKWLITDFKPHQWQPDRYNIGGSLATILEATQIPNNQKAISIKNRLAQVPRYYENAIQQIKKPTREHTELAISQNTSLLNFLNSSVKKLLLDEKIPEAEVLISSSKDAIKKYIDFLNMVLKNPTTVGGFRSFRISPKHYNEKYVFEIASDRPLKSLYILALDYKNQTKKNLVDLSQKLWRKYFAGKKIPKSESVLVKTMISKISEQHYETKDFVQEITNHMPKLADFVSQKNLLYLDPKKPLKVRETPAYDRGVAVATVEAPGYFDSNRETYYNVSPIDDLTPEAQESYLREYNSYLVQILNIHEAIPGHYAQLVYSNKSPSIAKKLIGNGSMVEGWAVYAERMMMENGYADNSPELQLMYQKWFLRTVCNTIIDYSVHNLNWSREKTINFLMNEAFQEATEAEKKWNRITYSQVQLLSYFSGFVDIYQWRELYKKQLGEKFSLKEFNEKFLSFGNASITSIKKLMSI